MNTRFIPSAFATAAAASIATLLGSAPAAAQVPSPSAGVTCRAGTTAEFDNGVLRCRVREEIRLASICSPLLFASSGSVDINFRVEMRKAGRDQCVSLRTGETKDSAMAPPVPGLHPEPTPGTYRRVVSASQEDVFVADKISYEFPQGWAFVGNPARGVSCGDGFSTERINGGRGLRCIKVEERVATCDGGYTVQQRNGVDLCIKRERDFLGNEVIRTGQFTIPANAGYAGLLGNPAQNGWTLLTDRNGRADHWRKGRPDYQFPRAG